MPKLLLRCSLVASDPLAGSEEMIDSFLPFGSVVVLLPVALAQQQHHHVDTSQQFRASKALLSCCLQQAARQTCCFPYHLSSWSAPVVQLLFRRRPTNRSSPRCCAAVAAVLHIRPAAPSLSSLLVEVEAVLLDPEAAILGIVCPFRCSMRAGHGKHANRLPCRHRLHH